MYYMTCSHPNVTELLEKGAMASYSLKLKRNDSNGLL